ncbi:hypothetical protein predicted by Glimmer/Critica [Sorangium cellulosum So ce56]|uniref:Zer-1-like leucine-rich repeats region domain-containing protein n=1 Tax=Sorangium cellulosum (strain So ce56) TaxID=448385 RepID=A9FAB6_SORC5|nr:hypothetical protein predicted by Glimmer/Critica [Sorangium cellulosum So ce56]
MPRKQTVKHTRDDVQRTYVLWYTDDAPARRESVAFFQAAGRLFPAINIPREVRDMSVEEANEYLRIHPTQEQWEGLTLVRPIAESDLSRFEHVNELQRVCLMGGDVSDRGLKHLLWLKQLECLVLYSNQLTDACLETIRQMPSLRTLDMQDSRRVSRSAFEDAVRSLPQIETSYAPLPP